MSDERNNLPSWLQDDDSQDDDQNKSELPPWLADMDDVSPTPKKEVDPFESWTGEDANTGDLTYDEWFAQQQEERRVKDIEEEVPDFLAEEVPDTSTLKGKDTGQIGTGELPDWFLGLETLDEENVPDWLTPTGTSKLTPPAESADETVPPWMADMIEEEKAKEPPPVESSLPPMEDLFGEFAVDTSHPSPTDTKEFDDPRHLDWLPNDLNDDLDEVPDEILGLIDEPVKPRQTSELPSNEEDLPDEILNLFTDEEAAEIESDFGQTKILDAYDPFADALTQADPTLSIEDPDIEWFDQSPSIPEPPPTSIVEEETPTFELEDRTVQEEDTLDWLQDLQGIVSSVTRPEPTRPETPEFNQDLPDLGHTAPLKNAEDPYGETTFNWDDVPAVPDEPVAEEPSEPDFEQITFDPSQISPEDLALDEELSEPTDPAEVIQELPPETRRPSLLTGRLSALVNPEPEPEPETEAAINRAAALFDDEEIPDEIISLEPEPADDELDMSWFDAEGEIEEDSEPVADHFAELADEEIDFENALTKFDTGSFSAVSDPTETSDVDAQYQDLFADEPSASSLLEGATDADIDLFAGLESSEMEFANGQDTSAPADGEYQEPETYPADEAVLDAIFTSDRDLAQPTSETRTPEANTSEIDDTFPELNFDEDSDITFETPVSEWVEPPSTGELEELDLFSGVETPDLDLNFEDVSIEDEMPAPETLRTSEETPNFDWLDQEDGLGETPSDQATTEATPEWSDYPSFEGIAETDKPFTPAHTESTSEEDYTFDLSDLEALETNTDAPSDLDWLNEEATITESTISPADALPAWEEPRMEGEPPAQVEEEGMPDLFADMTEPELDLNFEEQEPAPVSQQLPDDPDLDNADWFAGLAKPTSSEDETPDLFGEFAMPSSPSSIDESTLGDFSVDDLLNETASEHDPHPDNVEDFFRTFEQSENVNAEPNWLDELDPSMLVDENEPVEVASSGEDFSLIQEDIAKLPQTGELSGFDFEEEETPAEFSEMGENLDDYLSTLEAKEAELLPQTRELLEPTNVDLDKILGEQLDKRPPTPEPRPSIPAFNVTDAPEWLQDIEGNVSEVSAAAMARKMQDRPAEDLDDRLKKLRQRGSTLPSETTAEPVLDPLSSAVPGLTSQLPTTTIPTKKQAGMGSFNLSDNQAKRVELLQSLVASTTRTPQRQSLSAIEMTYDSPYMFDVQTDERSLVHDKADADKADQKVAKRRRRRPRIDRFIITVLLAGAVIIPQVVPNFRVGNLPPASFAVGSAAERVFDQIDSVRPGTIVLLAVEYSPAAAAELDTMTEAVLRHLLMRGAYPVIIGSDAAGLLHASNILDRINTDAPFLEQVGLDALRPNVDYFVTRYLTAGVIGLRAISADTAQQIVTDIRGQTTDLDIRTLEDFGLVTVISDRAEIVRNYAEQIAPYTRGGIIAGVSYSASPLVEPYINANIAGTSAVAGLLVGYQDAYTYNTMIGNTDDVLIDESAPQITVIERNEERPAPIFVTPTPLPVTPTPMPTANPRGVNSTGQPVNVRSEPSTTGSIVGSLASNVEVMVTGANADLSWFQVELPNGTVGWIRSDLLRVTFTIPESTPEATAESTPEATPEATEESRKVRSKQDTTETPDEDAEETATSEVTPTRTPIPTRTPRVTVTPEVEGIIGGANIPPTTPREQRWYSMTLGILVSAGVITLGAIFNILRSLVRSSAAGRTNRVMTRRKRR